MVIGKTPTVFNRKQSLELKMVYSTAVSEHFSTHFEWNERRNEASVLLAHGKTQLEVAAAVNVTPKTIYNWLQDMEFAAEVDRLSLMVGIASRAQRLRWLNKTIANRINADGSLQTDKDVVDLIKIAISETDGVKIDLSKLAEMIVSDTDNDSHLLSSPINLEPTHQPLLSESTESSVTHPGVVPVEPLATTNCVDQSPATNDKQRLESTPSTNPRFV